MIQQQMSLMPLPTSHAAWNIVSELPPSIYQYRPNEPLAQMTDELQSVAEMGFEAVQLPPIHPVGREFFAGKRASAYAPADITGVSPFITGKVSAQDYLEGRYNPLESQAGWSDLKRFCDIAHAHKLRVVSDLVFGHTAKDSEVVRAHEEKFGRDFYMRESDGTIKVMGAFNDHGEMDLWHDVAPINHTGPVAEKIEQHCMDVIGRFMAAGVNCFRADSASRIPNTFWANIIENSKQYARLNNLSTPSFYAESLGTTLQDEVALIRDGRFDGVTTSLCYWSDFRQDWFLERMKGIAEVNGAGVSFLDNHDCLDSASKMFGTGQRLLAQLALTGFMSSSMTMLQGTQCFSVTRPSVFLDRLVPPATGLEMGTAAQCESFDYLLRKLLQLKHSYPVMRTPAYTQISRDGGPVIQILRTTPYEQILIGFNTSGSKEFMPVPLEFSHGHVIGVMTWPGEKTYIGQSEPRFPLRGYDLSPWGLTVFHRRAPEGQPFRTPF